MHALVEAGEWHRLPGLGSLEGTSVPQPAYEINKLFIVLSLCGTSSRMYSIFNISVFRLIDKLSINKCLIRNRWKILREKDMKLLVGIYNLLLLILLLSLFFANIKLYSHI